MCAQKVGALLRLVIGRYGYKSSFGANNEGSVALGLELNELYHNLVSKNESASVEVSKQMLERLYARIRSKVQGGFFLKPGG